MNRAKGTSRADNSGLKKEGLGRRKFIETAGKAAVGALVGGSVIAQMACEKKAPGTKSERRIHLLQWSNFIKDADDELRRQAKEFETQTGVAVTIEAVNANDLNARFTSAVESGQGPDILQTMANQSHLYAGGLLDVGDLVAEIGATQGEYYPVAEAASKVDGVWRTIPYHTVGGANVYRKDIFAQVGIPRFPDTFDEYLTAGRKLKEAGFPVGQSLGHTFGDAPGWCYSVMWGFGGMERHEDLSVVVNSPETIASIEFNTEFYKTACDEGGLAWDDSSNNRAFLAGTIAATYNGASIYFVARQNPDTYPGLAVNLDHALMPRGPGGRHQGTLPFQNGIAKYSPNKEACMDFIRFLMAEDNYSRWFGISSGYSQGATTKWEKHPVWDKDPAVSVYRDIPKIARTNGYAGPYDRKSSEVFAKYIVVDMYAKVAQGSATPKSAAAWAQKEMELVYDRA